MKYCLWDDWADVEKMFDLGYYYQFKEKNYKKMEICYLKCIKNGHIDAMFHLGMYHLDISKNENLAKKYLLMAYNLNPHDDNILNCLGIYYKRYERDYTTSKKYYLQSIEKGNVCAMYNLGLLYNRHNNCMNVNVELMIKYYLMAIENGNISAMIDLGDYYSEDFEHYQKFYPEKYKINNINNEHSKHNCVKYYKMAIVKGSIEAMFKLGYYYDKEKKYVKMLKYYYMASNCPERTILEKRCKSDALNCIGYYYGNNKYDFHLAKKYFMQAIAITKANTTAMYNLGNMYKSMTKMKSNQKYMSKYEKYMLLAAKNGNIYAFRDIHNHYIKNINNIEISDIIPFIDIINYNNYDSSAADIFKFVKKLNEFEIDLIEIDNCFLFNAIEFDDAVYNFLRNEGVFSFKETPYYVKTKFYTIKTNNIKENIVFDMTLNYYTDNLKEIIIDKKFINFITNPKYRNNLPKLFKSLSDLYLKNINIIESHFKYSPFPENDGYNKAKEEFYNLCYDVSIIQSKQIS